MGLSPVSIVHAHTTTTDVYSLDFSAQRQLRYNRAKLISVVYHDQLQSDLRPVGVLKGKCPRAIGIDRICTGFRLKSGFLWDFR